MSNKRIKYNTPVNFPQSFTLTDLYNANEHKIKRITLYTRIQKGIESGTIVEGGLRQPDASRRGRREQIYNLVDAQPVTAGGDSNW